MLINVTGSLCSGGLPCVFTGTKKGGHVGFNLLKRGHSSWNVSLRLSAGLASPTLACTALGLEVFPNSLIAFIRNFNNSCQYGTRLLRTTYDRIVLSKLKQQGF